MRSPSLLLGMLVAGALLASPAAAIFVETPLTLTTSGSNQVQVGQAVPFTVDALNETTRAAWANQAVRVEWRHYDDEVTAAPRGVVNEALMLDSKAHAEFTFTVPPEAQDKNIFVQLVAEGEHLAQAHLAVGNAEPIMFAAGGGPADTGGAVREDMEGPPKDDGKGQVNSAKNTPGPGAVVALAGLAAVAVLLARRRR